MEEKDNVFLTLYGVNVNDKAKKKQNLTYLSWAWAWAEIKKRFPDAEYKVYHRTVHSKVTLVTHFEKKVADGVNILEDTPAMDKTEEREVDNEVNYFTDGNTCWVKVSITINGLEHIEELPIMDLRNQPVYGGVNCVQVNKAIQRALTKAAARHGLGLYIYAGEDLPEDTVEDVQPMGKEQAFIKLRTEVVEKMNGLFGTAKEEQVAQYIMANFNGVPVSQCDISYYDKLSAAKEFIDKL